LIENESYSVGFYKMEIAITIRKHSWTKLLHNGRLCLVFLFISYSKFKSDVETKQQKNTN